MMKLVVSVFLVLHSQTLLSYSSMLITPSTTHVRPQKLYTCVPHAMCVWSCPPKRFPYKYEIQIRNKAITNSTHTEMDKQGADDAEKIRFDFLEVLRSRRSAEGTPFDCFYVIPSILHSCQSNHTCFYVTFNSVNS